MKCRYTKLEPPSRRANAPEIQFDSASHTYAVAGQRVPNVSLVTDALQSYAGVPAAVLKAKAELGQAVHYATELDDANDLDDDSLPEATRGYVDAWRAFRRDTGWVTHASEVRIYSAHYRYAGTLDCVGHFDRMKGVSPRRLCVVDKKCTYRLMPAVRAQVAAYAQAYRETFGRAVDRVYAVRLNADGTFELAEFNDPTDLSTFLSALAVLAWKERLKLELTL